MSRREGTALAYAYLKRKRKEEKMRWECVEVSHHKDVGRAIEEWQKNGWSLHSYTAAGNPGAISHYLLFKRSE
jgi:mevalonate pyrophosphate decarboxylase